MVQYPRDIQAVFPHVLSKNPGALGLSIPQHSNYKGGDILQATHCLELVLSGSNRVNTREHFQNLQSGDIQFRKRGNYQVQPSPDYSGLLFFMEDKFILEFLKEHIVNFSGELFNEDLPPFLFKSSDFIEAHIKETISSLRHQHTFSSCIIKLSLHQILLHIMAVEKSRTFVTFLKYLISTRKMDLSYFMETNFTENLTLREMAKQTGRSLSSFKDDFNSLFGMSPSRWIMNRRLEYANYLLKNTDDPISEIAHVSGFESAAHFSKKYRQKFGVTPSASKSR